MPSVSQCPPGTSLVFPAVTSGRNEPRRRFLSPAISAGKRALLCSVTREEWNGRGGKWDERTEVVVVVAQEGFPCLRPTTQPSFPSAPSVRPSVRPSVPFSERPLFSRPLLFLPPRPPFVSLFPHSQGNATAGLIVLRLRLLPPRLSCPLVQRTNRSTQKEEPPPPSDRGATSTPLRPLLLLTPLPTWIEKAAVLFSFFAQEKRETWNLLLAPFVFSFSRTEPGKNVVPLREKREREA